MKSILVASLAMMSGYYSSPLAPSHLSHLESERDDDKLIWGPDGWRPKYLNLKKYLTNRSPKRLQSLLASMAHAKYSTQWRTRTKVGPTTSLSTEYKLARITQIDAEEKQITGLTVEKMEERDRLFNSLPRRVRRQLNRGRANL